MSGCPHVTSWLLLVALLGAVTDCFSTRNARPLASGAQAASTVPILPVLASQVRITVTLANAQPTEEMRLADAPREDYQRVADLVNEIVDDLTREHARLVGPSQARRLLPDAALERLFVYLDDPGPIDEAWKVRGLEEIRRELDVDSVVRLRIQLLVEEQAFDDVVDPTNRHWRGRAKVTAELLGLAPASVQALGEGQDRVWGAVGVAGVGGYGGAIIVPYALGRGLGRSLDNAARQALGEVLDAMGVVR